MMNVFSSKTFMVLMHIASPNAFGNCVHMVINKYTPCKLVAAASIMDESGNQIDLPARIYLNDALMLALDADHMKMVLTATIEATSIVMGEPDVAFRQCPLAMDTWLELVIGPCENIHSWISLSGDLVFSHQQGIYSFKFPKRFLEISFRDLTLLSILII
jgi:hypothetical protein